MSGEGEDESEKSHEPTQKRLDEARRRGELPRSADLVAALGQAGLWGAAALLGPGALLAAGEGLAPLLGQADRLADATFGGDPRPLWGGLLLRLAGDLWPFAAVPAALALLAALAQGVVVAPERLRPKGDRLNPVAGLGRRFGRAGLAEFALALGKLVAVGAVTATVIAGAMGPLLALTGAEAGPATAGVLGATLDLLRAAAMTALALGLADLLWQRLSFLRRHRMSRRELTDEMKESEGDPHIKGQRRSRAVALATNRMLRDVETAQVVIVNPTHYAVALRWDKASGRAPVVVAKGVDEVAARIRERALAAGVPVHRDPPTARALHASLGIGDEVLRPDWRAVAAAIRFAERVRARARERGRR